MTLRTVEIVGGGLAGLSLGLGLRNRQVPVRLLEAGTYPRHRVCGEFITGLGERTKKALCLEPLLKEVRQARSVSWYEPGHATIQQSLPEPALCLSRYQLDGAMAKAFVRAGGELHTGRRLPRQPSQGRVLACGRRLDSSSRWLGVKQHFRFLPLRDDLELHLGKRAYVGLTQVEDGVVNVCGLFPRESTAQGRSFSARLCAVGLHDLSERIQQALPVPNSLCAVAGLDYGGTEGTGFTLGDNHRLVPPFTGHGMTIALQSAEAALDFLQSWSRGECSWEAASRGFARKKRHLFGARYSWGNLLHPWLLGRRHALHLLHRWRLLPLEKLYRLCH